MPGVTDKPAARPASYLSPPDLHRLDWACHPIRRAFGQPPYLVGSALTRPDFRDIDLRLILPDERLVELFGEDVAHGTPEQPTPSGLWLLLNVTLSDYIAKAAHVPWTIDFQIQSRSEADEYSGQMRNPMGVR